MHITFHAVESTIVVKLRNTGERRIAPFKVIYVASDKAIGCNILTPHESWNNASDVIVDDEINIVIHICVLDTTEGCQNVEVMS
jgi:hypothetical protein